MATIQIEFVQCMPTQLADLLAAVVAEHVFEYCETVDVFTVEIHEEAKLSSVHGIFDVGHHLPAVSEARLKGTLQAIVTQHHFDCYMKTHELEFQISNLKDEIKKLQKGGK